MTAGHELADRRGGNVRPARRGTRWSPGLAVAVALTYIAVAVVFFGSGYLIGRLLL